MASEVYNCLYIILFPLSILGLTLLFKKRGKLFCPFFTIILFCLLWRAFRTTQSSRYYAIFVFWGLLSTFFVLDSIIRKIKRKNNLHFFLLIFIVLVIFIHFEKTFGSFRNIYILDLSDEVNRYLAESPGNTFFIYYKEYLRIKNSVEVLNNRIQPAPTDSNLDLTDLYVHTSSYDNNMFYLSSDKSTLISPRYDWSVFNGSKEMYRIIERHATNANHSSHVSIYKHVPFFPRPDIDLSFLGENAVLKVYEPEYNAYVFQQGNKLIWLIGADIDKSTEILFSLYTDRVDLLPPKRIQYGFDNLSFRVGDKSEKEKKGSYHHFEKVIPSQYPISFVRVGFNTNGNIIYTRDFSVIKQFSSY